LLCCNYMCSLYHIVYKSLYMLRAYLNCSCVMALCH
jgi:hypothetical protein